MRNNVDSDSPTSTTSGQPTPPPSKVSAKGRAKSLRPGSLNVNTGSNPHSASAGLLSSPRLASGSSNSGSFLPKILLSGEFNTDSTGAPMSPGTASSTIFALGTPSNAVNSPLLGKGRVSLLSIPQRGRNSSSCGSTPGSILSTSAPTETGFNEGIAAKPAEPSRPNLEEYHLEKVVAGGQGTVYRGTCPKAGTEVAVKRSNLKDDAPRVNAEREKLVFRALKKHEPHPRLMSAEICFVDEDEDEMVTVMKYYPSDLYTAIKVSEKGVIDGPVAYRLTDQLLDAIAALHKRGYVHRDIKPENIMLTSTDIKTADLVLCDYGLCGIITKSVMLRSSCGSKRYAAPEVWNKEPADTYDGIKVDLWSIGMVFFCLYCGFCPWEIAATTDKVFKVWKKDATVFFDWAKKFSINEVDPITKMLFRGLCHPDPKERLCVDDARTLIRTRRSSDIIA